MNHSLPPDLARDRAAKSAPMSSMNATASASRVNRTHRVIRERARAIKDRKNRARSVWIPMIVCSAMIVIFCSAIWNVLDEYELTPTGIPDSSDQIFVLVLWFFPVSAALLAMAWFRRNRIHANGETAS